jgi:hypothetical protein
LCRYAPIVLEFGAYYSASTIKLVPDMRRLLLHFCLPWLLLLAAAGTGYAQQASASLECCADQPICAGETTSLRIALEGEAPYTFRYSDGFHTETVSTSEKLFELKVAPQSTKKYVLISMQDAAGSGTVCGSATVAVNQCQLNGEKKDCASTCFSSAIIAQSTSGSCTTYTLEVTNDGSCQSALSHLNISVPCGSISQASNSRGWPMEIGTTDPTTGITGIKVDNINRFGEGLKAESFTVTYTICANSCSSADPYCGFLLAYKAGQCVNYGTAIPTYQPMSGQLATTAVRCHGESGGSIALSLSGGAAPYTYQWSNGATTANLEGVAAGTYTLVITDAASKTLFLSATVTQPQPLSLSATELIRATCKSPGSITVSASGGTAPYTYLWNTGASGPSLNEAPAGSYTLTVTDFLGCQHQQRFSIQQEAAPALSIGSTRACTSQHLQAVVRGTSGPYTYAWSTGQTLASITASSSGTYSLTVTDANGCTVTASTEVVLSERSLSLYAHVEAISCGGTADGAATITVSGGTAPYSYDWSNGLRTAAASNLAAGVYSVKVTDAAGCYDVVAFEIKQSSPIQLTLANSVNSSCGQANGSLRVSASGGIAPYTYKWNTGTTTASLIEVATGAYTVAVIDALGCSAEATYLLEETTDSSPLQAWIENCTDLLIQSGNTATFGVSFAGTGPYTFTYTDGSSTHSITTSDNPYALSVQPTQNSVYQLLSVSNGCGAGEAWGRASVAVVWPKTQVCIDGCFSTDIISSENSGSCTTYTLQVSADGSCTYALSHVNIALMCGQVSNMSNSMGWPMVVGQDPTTGLYSIKVDDIDMKKEGSFTVTYTLCNTESCIDANAYCGPLVAYKAGQCVYYGQATPAEPVAVNPDDDGGFLGPEMQLTLYPNPMQAGTGLTVQLENLFITMPVQITITTLTGQKVHESTASMSYDVNYVYLPLPQITAGSYIVYVTIGSSRYSKQLFVL